MFFGKPWKELPFCRSVIVFCVSICVLSFFVGACATSKSNRTISDATSLHGTIGSTQLPVVANGDDLSQRMHLKMVMQAPKEKLLSGKQNPDWLRIGGDIETIYGYYDLGAVGGVR